MVSLVCSKQCSARGPQRWRHQTLRWIIEGTQGLTYTYNKEQCTTNMIYMHWNGHRWLCIQLTPRPCEALGCVTSGWHQLREKVNLTGRLGGNSQKETKKLWKKPRMWVMTHCECSHVNKGLRAVLTSVQVKETPKLPTLHELFSHLELVEHLVGGTK